MSYKGAEAPKPQESQALSVESYMAKKLITFKPDQFMHEVVDSLLRHRISGAPVVGDNGELVGIISEGDCLKEAVKGKYDNMPMLSGKVSDHMAQNVVTVDPGFNIFDAAKLFLDKRLRRFPVIDQGKLVGQISQKDVMSAVLKVRSATWGS